MAEINEHPAQEQGLPLTAPLSETQAGTLPEAPSVNEETLRAHAAALAAEWKLVVPEKDQRSDLASRLTSLGVRLKDRLAACRAIASTDELTPQLELLEAPAPLKACLRASAPPCRSSHPSRTCASPMAAPSRAS